MTTLFMIVIVIIMIIIPIVMTLVGIVTDVSPVFHAKAPWLMVVILVGMMILVYGQAANCK